MFAVISTLSITFWVAISFALLERRDNRLSLTRAAGHDKAVENTHGITNLFTVFVLHDRFLSFASASLSRSRRRS